MKTSSGTGDYEKAPPGNHPAVLVALIDLGRQWQDGYQGAPGKWTHRVFFAWELVAEKKADGTNHVIGIDLTLSLNEKSKLRKWIEARGGVKIPESGEYDVSSELGKPCLLSVLNNEKGYPKIDGVTALPRGMTCPPATRNSIAWNGIAGLKVGEKATLPDWLPWFYGEPLADVIARCEELGGTADRTARATATATVGNTANGPPPRRTDPASPQYTQGTVEEMFYVDHAAFDAVKVYGRREIQDWLIQSKDTKPDQLHLCKQGEQRWCPANLLAFAPSPF